jgi:hypothetical protein
MFRCYRTSRYLAAAHPPCHCTSTSPSHIYLAVVCLPCRRTSTAIARLLLLHIYCRRTSTAVAHLLPSHIYCRRTSTSIVPLLPSYLYCCRTSTAVAHLPRRRTSIPLSQSILAVAQYSRCRTLISLSLITSQGKQSW